jgi:hypothetical protein
MVHEGAGGGIYPASDTGRVVASEPTDRDADDGSRVGHLLDQADGPVASLTGDGAYDRDDVYAEVTARHPGAAVAVSPRSSAVPSDTAETAPTQRDAHPQCTAERGSAGWQRVGLRLARPGGVRRVALEAGHRRWAPLPEDKRWKPRWRSRPTC